MRVFLTFCITISMSTTGLGQAVDDPAALMAIENQLLEATAAHNDDFLAALYDDQFHGVLASGHTVDKATMLEHLETSSPYVILSIEELKVALFSSIAITTGKSVSKSKSGTIIGQSRFTHIYQKKNNKWKMIESQNTVIIQN